ncbi:DUF6515 family protein [Geminisphaera colitermitum]|uniref:DUF6515 family protein n=1 Tax=Geminisphaera colitermitum TaxID=1148786 RepID=UPI000158CBFE|nr:DUF6515 family protein [Geminisphaera colitermitum]
MKATRSLRSLLGCFLVVALGATGLVAQPRNGPPHHNGGKSSGSSFNISVGVGTPGGFVQVAYGKDKYYYNRGVFYQPWAQSYRVVRPPYGCVVPVLPPRYARVYVGNTFYYRYDDIYYQQVSNGYMVVAAPAPVVVNPAPATQVVVSQPATPAPVVKMAEGAQSVWVGDVEYLFKDGQFFRKTKDGLIWSEAPMGAITRTLPLDATSVWYQDIEYFECDNIYFRKTPDGYKVVTAPWKTQLQPSS